ERSAQGQRTGVAHEDLGRRGVPPQETETGTHDRRADDREVERISYLVTAGRGGDRAGLVVLPDVDQEIGTEDQDAGTGRQTVETVGEVDGVAETGDQEPDEDHQEDRRDLPGVEVPDERDVVRRR